MLNAPLQAAEDEPVLVWRLKALGVDKDIAEQIESLLKKEIGRVPGVRLVGPEAIGAAIVEAPDLARCGGQAECLLDLGRRVGAKRVLSGVLGKLGDTFSLDLKTVDVEAAVESGRLAQTWGGGDETLIEVMRQVATRALRPGDYLGRVALSVNADQAKVFLDGDFVGRTPLPKPLSVAPGRHALKLVREGYADVERFVDVHFDRQVELQISLEETVVRERVQSHKVHRWWNLGMKTGLVSNGQGYLAPQLDLELGLVFPWWGGRFALLLISATHGSDLSSSIGSGSEIQVDGGLVAWPVSLCALLRLLPDYTFSPYLLGGGGLALVWQTVEVEGFEPQGFRLLRPTLLIGAGLEYRLGPGALSLEVRYQHLRLDSGGSEGGFGGLAGGLGVGLGYRLML